MSVCIDEMGRGICSVAVVTGGLLLDGFGRPVRLVRQVSAGLLLDGENGFSVLSLRSDGVDDFYGENGEVEGSVEIVTETTLRDAATDRVIYPVTFYDGSGLPVVVGGSAEGTTWLDEDGNPLFVAGVV